MVIVQQSAEARPTGDLAICPVVIRRTDGPVPAYALYRIWLSVTSLLQGHAITR
jgi:hypothetical protein